MSANTVKSDQSLAGGDFLLIFVAGVIGEIVLETISWVISPRLLGLPMRPYILLADLARSLLGVKLAVPLTVAAHLALGAFIMPLIYVKARQALGLRSWLLAGIAWGVVLWLIAQAILAPLAGRPIFLGFIPYSWGSLAAHIIYAVVVAGSLERLRGRFPHPR